MNKKIFVFSLIILLFCNFLVANEKEKISEKNATKAMLYSFIVPGGGQFYNQKYFKSVAVFATEAIMIGYAIDYHIKMNDAWDDENQAEYSQFYDKRQNMYWWFGAIKFLSVVDAFVDAKLYDFEEKKRKIELKFDGNTISLSYRF
ncbi:MAG: hypothetical protein H8E33_01545 [Candidatus Cloacimonetes bacterium]|nr:hypothetical protein [Candidatus Cloacimonadota bacterium]